MLWLGIVSAAYVIVSLWYIHKLHVRIRAHEQGWATIEKITDANKDGDIVIHAKHIED